MITVSRALSATREVLDAEGFKQWNIAFHDTHRAIARVEHDKKRVSWSLKWLPKLSENEFNNILIHELSHIVTAGHGHDKIWRDCAKRLGIQYNISVTAEQYYRCGELLTLRDMLGEEE